MKCPACGYDNLEDAPACNLCQGVLRRIKAAPAAAFDYIRIAEEAVARHKPQGLNLDFSPASVASLDVFISETWGTQGCAPRDDSWKPNPGQKQVALSLGSYFGEVLRRAFGGHWHEDPAQPGNPFFTRLAFANNDSVFPLARVLKRLKNGTEDSLEVLLLWVREKTPAAPNPQEALQWCFQGQGFQHVKRWDLALPFYKRAAGVDPNLALAHHNMGLCLRQAGKAQEALAAMERALRLEPSPPSWSEHGLALAALGRREEALGSFDRALGQNPRFSPAIFNKACVLADMGRLEEAVAACRGAVSIDPRDQGAWTNLSSFLNELGRPEEGMVAADQALAINPKNAGALSNKASALVALKRWAEALDAAAGALALDAKMPEAWGNKGAGLEGLGRFREAVGAYDEAIKLAPGFLPAQKAKARAQQKASASPEFPAAEDPAIADLSGQAQDAFTLIQKTEELFQAGIAAAGEGRNEEALALLDQAIARRPAFTLAWINKGYSLQDLGRLDEALAAFEKAVSGAPRNAVAWQAKGDFHQFRSELEQALSCYDRSLELDPKEVSAWYNKGGCLTKMNRIRESIDCFRRVVEFDPRDANAWWQIANLAGSSGLKPEAREALERYIAVAPPEDSDHVAEARRLLKSVGG